ncbi:hypothetical protein [Streptomyces sp. NPDC096339]|uniref:hypothetical protein n=1 Tax=Streptomyces sp. NPDC096339 TaxID=3366086 RepID=UPI0037F65C15
MNGDGGERGVRRAGLVGGSVTALCATVASVAAGAKAGLPWWAVVAAALPTGALAGWAGARAGRRDGVKEAALEPGETLLGAYAVRPPTARLAPPSGFAAGEEPRFQLRMTTRGLQLWECSVLWRHPWPELRVTVDGPRLRVHHQGREVGVMLVDPPGTVQEIRLAARRCGAG